MNLFNRVGLLWKQHQAFQSALTELKSYSDRELAELNLSRGDITRVAYEEAERRMADLHGEEPVRGRTLDLSFFSPSAWRVTFR